ncbi:MAG TPA: hypothetical protein VND22_02065 [Actinomycetota bacterium]|nr:hypothetical protein [Actinomycetota bacterium]
MTIPTAATRRTALRRYPALLFVLVAGALALALPSGLNVPLSGPSTLAEYAPVPGPGEGASDLSEVGSGSSGDLGFGSGRGGPGGLEAPQQPGQLRARLKRCVGKPPRQTEDPLSPPCVAHFQGNNFGATSRGVTEDEVRIVIYLGLSPNQRLFDIDDPNYTDPDAQTEQFLRLVRAYSRYFNDRYQTYQRRVHFYGYKGNGSTAPQIRAQVEDILQKANPFAILPFGSGTESQSMAREAAQRDIVVASYSAFDREFQQGVAPFLLSYAPDLQDEAEISASYVCRKLTGRPAVHSGNVRDRTRTRKFGIVFQRDASVPEHERLKDLMVEQLLEQCNVTPLVREARTTNEGQPDYGLGMAAMREAEVTTVIGMSSSTGPTFWGGPAGAQGYYPEWIIPGRSLAFGVDDNSNARGYPAVFWSNAFGLTYDYRRGSTQSQRWYAAYREGCKDCPEPASNFLNANLYDTLNLFFWGIQAAGPRLSPASMDKGLHAIPERRSTDPIVPAAYFEAGNYSWVKDGAEIWWDPAGEEPGSGLRGCYRMTNGGQRFRAGEWPEGDGDIKRTENAPCQGSVRGS